MARLIYDDDGNVIGVQSDTFREARPELGEPGQGWRIMSDGRAEMNNLTVRPLLVEGPGA